jgi:hypothetical protein
VAGSFVLSEERNTPRLNGTAATRRPGCADDDGDVDRLAGGPPPAAAA